MADVEVCDCPFCPIGEYLKTCEDNHLCQMFCVKRINAKEILLRYSNIKKIGDDKVMDALITIMRYMNRDDEFKKLKKGDSLNNEASGFGISVYYAHDVNKSNKLFKLCMWKL